MSECLTIALSKGMMMSHAMKALKHAGCDIDPEEDWARKLYMYNSDKTIRLLQVRPWDVPAYVEQGAADLGIAGRDVLIEKGEDVVSLLDLKFGACRLVIAGPEGAGERPYRHDMTVATKYPNSAERFFLDRGLNVKLIKLYGAVELAPTTGLSELICDLSATGQSLKDNRLCEIDTVFHSSAYLIANRVSLTFQYKRIVVLVDALRAQGAT